MSITKSQTEIINSIFNGNRFIIPTYQRKYSWTDNERMELWQDIEESLKDKMNHFVGTLSFKENRAVGLSTDTTYEIIDGQQRLTTIYILLSVLIEKIQDDTIRKQQLTAFIGGRDNLKLKPLGDDGSFLNTLLFDYSGIDPNKLNRRSQIYLYSAKSQFKSLVNPLSQQENEDRIMFIRHNLEVLVFNVESQAQAVKMFSIINDRGLPLRTLDKTKSILMLYSTIHLVKEKLNTFINNGFENIFDSYDDIIVLRDKLGILNRLEENTIFTHHYYSSRKLFPETWNNRDGAESVFNNLKQKCEKLKDKPEDLELFIKAYVDDFKSFAMAYAELIRRCQTDPLYEKPFRFLEFSATLYPLLVRLFMRDKLNELLGLLETIEVRIYKLRGTNPIADIYWLSSAVTESSLSMQNIRERLISFSEKFMNDYSFGLYLADNIASNNNVVKYILSEYSNDLFTIDSYKDFQIEHVFSKDPNFDPENYGFNHDYDHEKNTIGNLALIEQKINKSLGNLAPINKVQGYLMSMVTNTKNLAGEIQKGNFNKTSIDNRKKSIIDFCISRFTLN